MNRHEIFCFTTEEDRSAFLRELLDKWPSVQHAIATDTKSQTPYLVAVEANK